MKKVPRDHSLSIGQFPEEVWACVVGFDYFFLSLFLLSDFKIENFQHFEFYFKSLLFQNKYRRI